MARWIRGLVMSLCTGLVIAGCSVGRSGGQATPTAKEPSSQQERKLRIGVNVAAYPLSWRDDNQVFHGYAVDVGRRLAELITGRADSAVFEPILGNVTGSALERGRLEMVMDATGLSSNDVPKVTVSRPYLTESTRLMVLKSSGFRTPEDLREKTVAYTYISVRDRFRLEDFFGEKGPDGNVTLTGYPILSEALPDLKTGNIAALSSLTIYLAPVLKENPDLELLPDRIGSQSFPVYTSITDPELSRAVDQAIATMEQNGELKELAHKWGADL